MTLERGAGETGYAMVAAVAGIAVFALVAVGLQSAMRGSQAMVAAELGRARVEAAADAGLAMALNGVLASDPAGHWPPDGRTRQLDFAGSRLAIRVEDERGKVPIGLLDEAQAGRLLAMMGLTGDRLRIARDSLLDWTDEDDEVRPDGAESAYYAPLHISPRNGAPHSIDELVLVRGFDPALVERLRPIVTVDWGGGPFQPRYASPEALAIMTEGEDDTPAIIARRRELAGQVTALDFTEKEDMAGRALRVIVEARSGQDATARHSWVVELTGSPVKPYTVRSME